MSKSKLVKLCMRFIAFLMTAVIVISNVTDSSLISYAAEETYKGDVYDVNGKNTLSIHWNSVGFEFSEESVTKILQARKDAGEQFDVIGIEYPSKDYKQISAEVWNAAVDVLTEGGEFGAAFGSNEETYHINWGFLNPEYTEAPVIVNETLVFLGAGNGLSLSLASTDFPAEAATLEAIITPNKLDYNAMKDSFGTKKIDLEVFDSNVNPVTGLECIYKVVGDLTVDAGYGHLEIGGIQLFNAGEVYTVEPKRYKGTVSERNGKMYLEISGTAFEYWGEIFSEEAVLSILEKRKAAGEQFEMVGIRYPSKDYTTVSKEIWNCAAELLRNDSEEVSLQFYFEDWVDYSWNTHTLDWDFTNPGEIDEAINLSATFIPAETGLYFSFVDDDFPAEVVRLSARLDEDTENFEKFMTAFSGNKIYGVKVLGSGQVPVTNDQSDGYFTAITDTNCYVDLYCIDQLEANTTYHLVDWNKGVYKGYIDSWTILDEETNIVKISPWDAGRGGEPFTAEELIEILSRNVDAEGNPVLFDQIYVEQPHTEDTVFAEFVNFAIPYLKGEEILKFAFRNYEAGTNIEWWMEPALMSEDQTIKAELSIEDSTPILTIENKPENAPTIFYTANALYDETGSLVETCAFNKLKNIFGEDDHKSVMYEGTDTTGSYSYRNTEPASVTIMIGAEMGSHKIVEETYVGDIYDISGRNTLIIDWQDTYFDFSEEAVAEILLARKNAGYQFDKVAIEYPSKEYTQISTEVWNAAVDVLKDDGMLGTAFGSNADTYHINWEFLNPEHTDKQVVVDESIEFLGQGMGMCMGLASTEFPAQAVTVGAIITPNKIDYSAMKDSFGTEKIALEVFDSNMNPVGGLEGIYKTVGDLTVDAGYGQFEVSGVHLLSADETYTIAPKCYRGYESEDGTELFIDWKDFAEYEMEVSHDAFVKTLEHRAALNCSYDFLHLIYPDGKGFETVPKAVWDAAKVLSTYNENMIAHLQISFENEEQYTIHWNFKNLHDMEDGEVVTLEETMGFLPGTGMTFTSAQTDMPSDGASICIYAYASGEAYNSFVSAFGDRAIVLEVLPNEENAHIIANTGGNYEVRIDENGKKYAWLTFGTLFPLQEDREYRIQKTFYRGNVVEDKWFISAEELGVEKLTKSHIEKAAAYYAGTGVSFKEIILVQPEGSSNVISKDLVNLFVEKELLDDGGQLIFQYLGSEENDMVVWTLTNPVALTKDINANITITALEHQGITVKFNAGSCNGNNVEVDLVAGPGTTLGEAIVKGVGEPGDGMALVVMKTGTQIAEDINAIYVGGFEQETAAVRIKIDGVQNFVSGTNYILNKYKVVEKAFAVDGVDNSLADSLSYPLDAGKKVTWKSFDTSTAEIDASGNVKAIREGEFYASAKYISGGKSYLEIFKCVNEIKLQRIAFDQNSIFAEYQEDNRYRLNVLFYPANAAMDPAELEWTVSGNDMIQWVVDENADHASISGQFKVTGTGKAEIIASAGNGISTSCEITVVEPIEIPESDMAAVTNAEEQIKVYAITNFDASLADVPFPEGAGNWEWKEPSTKLSTYAGMESYAFPAVYTLVRDDGTYEIETNVEVEFYTISGINMIAKELDENDRVVVSESVPANLVIGQQAVWGWEYLIKNGNIIIGNLDDSEEYVEVLDLIMNQPEAEKLSITASNLVCLADLEGIDDDLVPYEQENHYVFKAVSAGTKTLKLSLKYGSKVVGSDSCTVKVVKNPIADFSEGVFEVHKVNGYLEFTFTGSVNYYKLTFKSSDEKVLKLNTKAIDYPDEDIVADPEYTDKLTIRVPYTEIKPGKVVITATAADAVKSTYRYEYTVVDRAPKLLQTSLNINRAADAKEALVLIQFADGYDYDSYRTDLVKLTGKAADKFDFIPAGYDNGRMSAYLALNDEQIKNGTYAFDLDLPVDTSHDDAVADDVQVHTVSFKVKVVNNVPSVTFKQTKKVNLFYDQSVRKEGELPEGHGILTVNTKNGTLTEMDIESDDFVLEKTGDVYAILYLPKEDAGTIEKKVKITYTVEDNTYGRFSEQTKYITINTEKKAPSLVISMKSDTLYPNQGYSETSFVLTDKVTGKPIDISEVFWVKSSKEIISLDDLNGEIRMPKNTYDVVIDGSMVIFTLNTAVNATDKPKLRVKESHWTSGVDVTYSVAVKTAIPQVKLGASKLTLNKHEDLYQYQIGETTLRLSGNNSKIKDEFVVRFTGTDSRSKSVLNQGISLSYDAENGKICAKLNYGPDTDVKARPNGTYKFKVWVSNGVFESSAAFSVVIVEKAPANSITVSKSGSIDVLRRDTTFVTYKPKMNNLTGVLAEKVRLIGQDADKFSAEMVNGRVEVKAVDGMIYLTNMTYKFTPVFTVVNSEGSEYEVEAKPQTLKVMQGKPTVKVTSDVGNTLYSQAGNQLKLNIGATLQNEEVKIEKVTLGNYTEDLQLDYNPEKQTITLSRKDVMDKITQDGKTWSLKFTVTFADKAGNVKDSQITYKVVVK